MDANTRIERFNRICSLVQQRHNHEASLFNRRKCALFIQLPPLLDKAVSAPELGEEMTELFEKLATGQYRNIVVFTGAGVSTAAGVPDFRSAGGLFETLRRDYGDRFPQARHNPEWLLSRAFAQQHPEIWEEIMLFRIQADYSQVQPTLTHRFCAWLHQKGWLKRIYTQNVDGLHLHPTLNMSPDQVVECHGSVRDASLVLYGDALPRRFFECCDQDFPLNPPTEQGQVDLVLVFGTSLQVAPFCAIPNMAPKGCTRVLVNRCVQDCLRNDFSRNHNKSVYGGGGLAPSATTRIGKHKHVSLRPLWNDSKANKKWHQLLVEADCDDFVRHFYDATSRRQVAGP
jgi:NAD-dependent SIR2 family protein deacetylase